MQNGLSYSRQVDAPETAYNERVVLFLRQPNIFDVLKEKTGSGQKSMRDKVNAIRQDGTLALDRLSCDVELTVLLRCDLSHPWPLFHLFSVLSNNSTAVLQQINDKWKKDLVCGAGIQTHDLLIISLYL